MLQVMYKSPHHGTDQMTCDGDTVLSTSYVVVFPTCYVSYHFSLDGRPYGQAPLSQSNHSAVVQLGGVQPV
jgi:hypothetical protein